MNTFPLNFGPEGAGEEGAISQLLQKSRAKDDKISTGTRRWLHDPDSQQNWTGNEC